jgi:uncharacterized protein YndB with AHSA1/START domain
MNQMSAVPTSDQNSVIHSTFSIERNYPQPPARVFTAFSDKEMVRRWRVEGKGWGSVRIHFRLPCRRE